MIDNNRKDDILVAQLTQRLNDLIERYDRDCGASSEWRRSIDLTLKEQTTALAEISPAYYRGKWVVGLVTLGSVGMAVKAFWQHLKWN